MQVYFFTITINFCLGFILISDFIASKVEPFAAYAKLVDRPVVRLVVGILGLFVGFLTYFPTFGGDIPFIGDLLPATTAILGGGVLIAMNFFNSADNQEEAKLGPVDSLFKKLIGSKAIIGAIVILAALLHMIHPQGYVI